jgi:L-fuconolactonase
MQIDSHHHFWKYDPDEYPWIGADMPQLRRDYLGGDLQTEIDATGIDGVVSVQARQTVEETRWLVSLAEHYPFIRGVVGWVPLADPGVGRVLDELATSPWLRGVRHVVQDEPDDAFILGSDFNRGIGILGRYGLVYDILVYARHLPATIRFVDRHPDQPFVLDHLAKPAISSARFDRPWATNLGELARRPHVWCKFSGLVTEVRDPQWSLDLLRPYWETALEAFGARRLLFGSDWPVCRLRCEYAAWVSTARELAATLTEDERSAVLGGNAMAAYRLPNGEEA